MAIIQGGNIIPGALKRTLIKAGVPASNDFNGQADKGDLCTDSTNGIVYINTGTLAATVWTKVGLQT
jgi:hypothetical protein